MRHAFLSLQATVLLPGLEAIGEFLAPNNIEERNKKISWHVCNTLEKLYLINCMHNSFWAG